ncbi:hypothetical protein TYRP_022197 [Tyrophagus putrescentiae]|nr:hypothetical protein TYRP_022197 [Tyrophagus putrescentiae]
MAAKIHFRDPFEHEPAPPPAETDKTILDDLDKGTEDKDKEKLKEVLETAYSASRQPPTAAQHQAILNTTLTPSSSAILSPEFKAHLAMELESPPVESMIRCVIPHECTEPLEIMADPLKKVPDLRVMEFKKTQFDIDPLIQMGRKAPAGKAEIWKPEPVAFRGASTSYWNDDEMPRPLMGVRPPDDPKFKDKPSFFANLRRRVKEEQESKKRKKEEEEEKEEKEKASKEQAAKEKEEKETKAKAKRSNHFKEAIQRIKHYNSKNNLGAESRTMANGFLCLHLPNIFMKAFFRAWVVITTFRPPSAELLTTSWRTRLASRGATQGREMPRSRSSTRWPVPAKSSSKKTAKLNPGSKQRITFFRCQSVLVHSTSTTMASILSSALFDEHFDERLKYLQQVVDKARQEHGVFYRAANAAKQRPARNNSFANFLKLNRQESSVLSVNYCTTTVFDTRSLSAVPISSTLLTFKREWTQLCISSSAQLSLASNQHLHDNSQPKSPVTMAAKFPQKKIHFRDPFEHEPASPPPAETALSPELKTHLLHLALELELPPTPSTIRCVIPQEPMVQKMAVPRRTVRDLRGMGFKKTHFRIDPLIRMGLQAPAGKAEIWKPEPVAFRGVSSYWNDDEMPRSLMPPRPPSDPRLRNKPSFFDNLKRRVKEEQEAKKKKKEEEEKEKAEKESQAAKEEEEKRKAKAKRARVQSEVYVKAEEEVSENSGKSKTKWVRVKCEVYIEATTLQRGHSANQA